MVVVYAKRFRLRAAWVSWIVVFFFALFSRACFSFFFLVPWLWLVVGDLDRDFEGDCCVLAPALERRVPALLLLDRGAGVGVAKKPERPACVEIGSTAPGKELVGELG